ncbi:MAG: hypothetical protein LC791_15195 [Acidobacteria bacterium]|nr:hypothetical protein [Acidobacteriota bacterium]
MSAVLSSTRVLVTLSTVAAVGAHGWLSAEGSALRWMMPTALLLGAASGWLWPRGARTFVFALAHVWPLIVFLAAGAPNPDAAAPWVALLLGITLVSSPLGRWSLPRAWLVPVAAWAVLLALGWPIVLWRELDFTLVSLQSDTLNGLFAWTPRQTAAFLTSTTLTQLSAILLIDWLWTTYGRRDDSALSREVLAPMTVGTSIAIAIGIFQGLVQIDWLNVGVWPRLGRATGTFLDANAFGAVAALSGAPVAGALLLQRTPWTVAAGAVLLPASGVAVWVSGSRTALLGWLIVAAGLTVPLLFRTRGSWRAIGAGLITLTLLLVMLSGRLGGPGTAVYRLWATLPSPTVDGATAFAGAMWERDGYGTAAVGIIREFPLTGVGPGSFPLFAPDYAFITMRKVIPPDNAQNWWRQQVAELGWLGSLPAIWCSWLVTLLVSRLWRRRADRPLALLVGAAIAALGVMSLVSPPTQHPLVLQTAAVLLFCAGRLGLEQPERPQRETHRAQAAGLVLLAVCLLPLVWAGLTLRSAVVNLRPPFRAHRIGWLYGYGFSAAEPIRGGEQRWAAHRAVGVIPAEGRRLLLTLEPAIDALAREPIRLRVHDRHQIVLDTERSLPGPVPCAVDVPIGERWVMVQIDSDGLAEAGDRALRVTARWE